ncbi:hypothetical protein, partial [Paenibacillus sp.]
LTYNERKTNKPLLIVEVSIDNNYHYHIGLILRSRFFPLNAFYLEHEKTALKSELLSLLSH